MSSSIHATAGLGGSQPSQACTEKPRRTSIRRGPVWHWRVPFWAMGPGYHEANADPLSDRAESRAEISIQHRRCSPGMLWYRGKNCRFASLVRLLPRPDSMHLPSVAKACASRCPFRNGATVTACPPLLRSRSTARHFALLRRVGSDAKLCRLQGGLNVPLTNKSQFLFRQSDTYLSPSS